MTNGTASGDASYTDLGYRAFDADNHYYEAADSFTRHIPKGMEKRTMQWAELNGKRRLLVAGRVNRFIPNPLFDPVARPGSLDEYFRGRRRIFELMLRLEGSEFQLDVWQALLDVPFGATASYRDIAQAVARPKSVRAVGAANGANPISLIIPCHRVIGADGRLVGYGGGLDRKEWLIEHEWKHGGQAEAVPKAKAKKAAKSEPKK
jgi:methylated-DNA-[protein]-cysteine S-methyltransferase